MFESVCSFLNTTGGYVILGANDKKEIIGIKEELIEKIKKDYTTQCNNKEVINPTILSELHEIKIDGKILLYTHIEESTEIHKCKGKVFVRNYEGDFDISNNIPLIASIHNKKRKIFDEDTIYPYVSVEEDLRHDLIENIISLVLKYDLDGINIDFENMHDEDKDLFSRFIIELKPRLNEIGAVLSVDVTAPDGSPEWSLCYDRYTIAQIADYIVFMGYDQYGESATTPGTNAGYNWVEANIQKFLGQEGVEADKLILGMYNGYLNPIFTKEANTRVYKSKDGIAFRFNYELIKQEVYPENNLINIKGLELY